VVSTASRMKSIKAKDILISADDKEIAELPRSAALTIKPRLSDVPWKYGSEPSLMERTRSIYDQTQPGITYLVKFHRENETQSHVVTLDGSGAYIARSIEGTNNEEVEPKKDEAQRLVEEYVRTNHAQYMPIKCHSIQKDGNLKRAGYAIYFLVPKFDIGDAHCVLKVKFVGDQVNTSDLIWKFDLGDLSQSPKIPLTRSIEMFASFGFIAAVLLFLLCWSAVNFKLLRSSWKALLIWLSVIFAANIFNAINDSVELIHSMEIAFASSAMPFVTIVLSVLKLGFFTAIQLLLCTSGFIAVQKHFPRLAEQLDIAFWLRPRNQKAAFKTYVLWRQACIGTSIMLWVDSTLANLGTLIMRGICTIELQSVSEIFNALVPAAHIVSQILICGIVVAAATAAIAAFCRLYLDSGLKFCTAIILLTCLLAPWDKTATYYFEFVLIAFFQFLFAWFALRNIFKNSAAIYLVLFSEYTAISNWFAIHNHTAIIGSVERSLLVGIILSPLFVLLLFWLRQKTMKGTLESPSLLGFS
jgi:hypothetical protein